MSPAGPRSPRCRSGRSPRRPPRSPPSRSYPKGSIRDVLALAPAVVPGQVVDELHPREDVEAERMEDPYRLRVAAGGPDDDLPCALCPCERDHLLGEAAAE